MFITDFRPLPPRPSLEQYKKQAKDLLKAFRASDPDVVERITKFLPQNSQRLTLTGAQLVVAREHGFASWRRFAAYVQAVGYRNSPTAAFELAADAIPQGEADVLRHLIGSNPGLVRERSMRTHSATLLHYTAANGVEDYRQKTPPNIAVIAAELLQSGTEIDAIANIYGRSATLSLAASSVHPQLAGVQIALLELLLERGAAIDGPPGSANPTLAALRNGRGDAASFLASRGAALDLESAAGTGHIDTVRAILTSGSATGDQHAAGLAWACQYGHTEVVEYLLDAGSDPNGMYERNAPLHWAAVGAQSEVARLLLEYGANPRALNRYGAMPVGQAQWSASHDGRPERFDVIIEVLTAAET